MKKFLKSQGIFLLLLIIFLVFLTGIIQALNLKVRVKVKTANVRIKPDITSTIITKVHMGTILESEGKFGKWYHVTLPPDENGFSISGYMHASTMEVAEKIIEVPKEEKPTELKKIPEVKRERPPTAEHQYSRKITMDPQKKIAYKIGGGISLPTGEWSDDSNIGFGGNGRVIYKVATQVDLMGGLDFNYFTGKENDYSLTRLIFSGAVRYNFKGKTAFFAEGGFSLFHDIFKYKTVDYSETQDNIGIMFGGGIVLSKIEVAGYYYNVEVEDENLNMLTFACSYRF